MLNKAVYTLFITVFLFAGCNDSDEASENLESAVGTWNVFQFQVLRIEGEEVLEDKFFLEAGVLALNQDGTGSISLEAADPWILKNVPLEWSLSGSSQMLLEIEGFNQKIFDIQAPNSEQMALVQMESKEETSTTPHFFRMTTFQMIRRQ